MIKDCTYKEFMNWYKEGTKVSNSEYIKYNYIPPAIEFSYYFIYHELTNIKGMHKVKRREERWRRFLSDFCEEYLWNYEIEINE